MRTHYGTIEWRQALRCVIEVQVKELLDARMAGKRKRAIELEWALEQTLASVVKYGWLKEAERLAKELERPLRHPNELRVIAAVAYLNNDRALMVEMEERYSIILRPEEVDSLIEQFALAQPTPA